MLEVNSLSKFEVVGERKDDDLPCSACDSVGPILIVKVGECTRDVCLECAIALGIKPRLRGVLTFNMLRCIFCLKEFEELTDEHVFPAALGGVLVLKDSVCAGCNNAFSKFEQPLATELAPLRLLLKIPGRYGEVPQAEATVKVGEKEYDARVKGDGKVQLKPIVTEVTTAEGKKEYWHKFVTERQKEKLRQEAKEKGREFIETGRENPK